eukprot:4856182-Prorocentrum_lima.AAC.1
MSSGLFTRTRRASPGIYAVEYAGSSRVWTASSKICCTKRWRSSALFFIWYRVLRIFLPAAFCDEAVAAAAASC